MMNRWTKNNDSSDKISLSPSVYIAILISLIGVLFFNNPAYLVCCLTTCYMLMYLLWKKSRPGILVFVMLMQWVQVVAYVLWMNNFGYDINRLSVHAGTAVMLSCLGLVMMAAILSNRLKTLKFPSLEQLNMQARLIDERKIL